MFWLELSLLIFALIWAPLYGAMCRPKLLESGKFGIAAMVISIGLVHGFYACIVPILANVRPLAEVLSFYGFTRTDGALQVLKIAEAHQRQAPSFLAALLAISVTQRLSRIWPTQH